MKSPWTRFRYNEEDDLVSHFKKDPTFSVIVRQDFRRGDWLIEFYHSPVSWKEPTSEKEMLERTYVESSQAAALIFAKKHRNDKNYWH